MRAAFYEGGERIRIGPCVPGGPAPGQVRIRVSHCGICGTDLHILHVGLSGAVESIGEGVTGWTAGDRGRSDRDQPQFAVPPEPRVRSAVPPRSSSPPPC